MASRGVSQREIEEKVSRLVALGVDGREGICVVKRQVLDQGRPGFLLTLEDGEGGDEEPGGTFIVTVERISTAVSAAKEGT